MNSNKTTARIMFDVRIILSALWAARMLCSLQGDTVRLSNPVLLKEMVAGTIEFEVSNELLLVMSIIMAIPIFMSFLSLTLKDKANRWANIIIGIFFTGYGLIGLPAYTSAYDQFLIIVGLVFTALIVWSAYKWK